MLHIVNKSHSESRALKECLDFIESGSVVLLIENAVLSAKNCIDAGLLETPPVNVELYVLSPDLQARGIKQSGCYAHIQCIDYDGFVELVVANNPVQSWF